MQQLFSSLPKSLEHATSRLKDQGDEAVDALGLGLMHSHTSSEASVVGAPNGKGIRHRLFSGKRSEEREAEEGEAGLLREPQRTTAIRFAEDSSASTDAAPGNYGSTNPAFKKNPALAMFRSTSVQSENPSVTFQEPDKPR